ncbi:MAG: protein BatD, partial [bacterium]|nr:protein BatD [bacterium]
MRRTTIGLAVAAALLVASAADAAQLDARLERRQLAPGETVNLLLRLRGGTERPELDVLTRDFDILKVTRSMRTSIVNNRVDSSLDWTVTLAPRGTGELEIPEIRAGDAVSAPIALQVAESPAALQVAESPSALDVAKGASALDVAKGASALDVAKGASALDV